MVARGYLRLAGAARQPENRCPSENYQFATHTLGFATELFQENAIFFLEVFDHSLLVSVHPAGDRDEQELELRRHRVENLSKVLVLSILHLTSAEFFGRTRLWHSKLVPAAF
jgi:hypothetical protein